MVGEWNWMNFKISSNPDCSGIPQLKLCPVEMQRLENYWKNIGMRPEGEAQKH